MRHYRFHPFITAFTAVMLLAMILTTVVQAVTPGTGQFQRTWERTDQPVLSGSVARTWMWGPEASLQVMQEPYAEAPGGERTVQYFDKARMEDNSYRANGAPWDVTNGLLVVELITGEMQTGDNDFENRNPAAVNVAGDADDPTGPTYATFGSLLDAQPRSIGATITERVDREANVSDDTALAGHGVTAGYLDEVTNHAIATPFWDFMNSDGAVYENGQYLTEALFEDAYFATGRPITEAYWANVKVGGQYRDVLTQCFERRCLTFTPGNPDGFIVEAGNVGQHYYSWRYGDDNVNDEPPVDTPDDTPDQTATNYQFLRKFGLPSDGNKIAKPNDVAAGPDGSVYMTDTVNRRILKFDSQGKLVTAWGSEGNGNGQFKNPRGIAVDDDGFVYVVDKKLNRVQKFDSNGAFVLAWGETGAGNGQFKSPHGVAVANNGAIVVADQNNNRIQIFNAEAKYLLQWSGEGSPNGQLKAPHGVTVAPSGLIYVADKGNNRVQLFEYSGAWQGTLGSEGAGDGQFNGPMSLAVTGNGNVYVTDVGNNRIQVFSPIPVVAPVATETRTLQAIKYQYAGEVDGEFSSPTGVDFDASGRLLVADRGNDRIQIFTSSAVALGGGAYTLSDVWTDDTRGRFWFGNPDGVVVAPDGRIYAVDNGQDLIKVFSNDGEYLDQYGPKLTNNLTLANPLDLALDADGNIYVSDTDLRIVVKLGPNGNFIAQFGATGSGNGQFMFPSGIAVDDDGNIYVTDGVNDRVQKFGPDFSFIASFNGPDGEPFDSPIDVAVYGDRLYVTDSGNVDKVRVFDLDGNFFADWDGFDSPTGLATDDDGYVYVGDKLNLIQKFSPDGELIATIGSPGTGDGELKLDTAGPRMDVDSDGNVYVGDSGNQRIQIFQPVS